MGDNIANVTEDKLKDMENKLFNKNNKVEKKHSKLKSVKTWLAIWAAANFSLVIWGVIFKQAEGLTPIAIGLLTIIAGYFGVNVYQKKLYKNDEEAEK